MPSRVELAAQEILRQRSLAVIGFGNPLDFLFDKQKIVVDAKTRTLALLAGRRGGKTVVAGAKLFLEALRNPRSISLYLALSRNSAEDIMWPEIREWGRRLNIPDDCFNDSRLRVYLPNGSRIIVTGTDDTATIERWRGTKLACAIVDECGSQPDSILTSLVRDILRPALVDLQGDLWLIGTPGFVADGYWFHLTNPERNSKTPLFSDWNILNNPHIPHAAQELRDILESEGWIAPPDICAILGIPVKVDEKGIPLAPSAAFMREWLGRWCIDLGELVYPYSDLLCGIDSLPTHNTAGNFLDPELWRFVIGVDVGVVDDTAIGVVAAHPDDSRDFIVSTEKHSRMLTNALADRLRELRLQYKGAPIIIDSGGMGKYHATDVQERYGIGVIAAEKTEKASHVRLYRERMQAGKVAILRGECNDVIRDEYTRIPWDKKKLLPKEGSTDHAADCILYAWRYLSHFTVKDTAVKPKRGSAEWHKLVAKEIQEKMEKEIWEARNQVSQGGILEMFPS